MWQIMWLLSLMPDWFYHLIVIVSLLGLIVATVFKFIPYRLPIQVFGALLLLFGIWMEGGIVNEAKWEARVKELEEKVKAAEAKSAVVNTVVQEKIVYKTKIVKEVQIKIEERIKEVEKIIDAECKVDPVAIQILNDAAAPIGEAK